MGPKPFEVHGTPDSAKKSVRVYRKLQETRDKRHYKKSECLSRYQLMQLTTMLVSLSVSALSAHEKVCTSQCQERPCSAEDWQQAAHVKVQTSQVRLRAIVGSSHGKSERLSAV